MLCVETGIMRIINLQMAGTRGRALGFWVIAVSALTVPTMAQQPNASAPPLVAASPANLEQSPVADPPAADSTEAMFPHPKDARFWLSRQTNFIFQAHPDFHSPYSGKNSLSPHYEKATSRVMTLYTGVRFNSSTELIVDIEEAGGAALTSGLGLAGAPNLDILRNPLLSKAPFLGPPLIP